MPSVSPYKKYRGLFLGDLSINLQLIALYINLIYLDRSNKMVYDVDVSRYTTKTILEEIEARFKDVANLDGDFSSMPMPKENRLQVLTNKEKSDTFGEVFTPIWLVDSMLERISDYEWRNPSKTTLDLCAGYGQFSVRMLRKKYDLMGNDFNIKKFLFKTHHFSELQLSSCYKLLHIFSPKINLFIGDSKELKSLPEECTGIWYFDKGWHNITDSVKEIFGTPKKKYSTKHELKFIEDLKLLTNES